MFSENAKGCDTCVYKDAMVYEEPCRSCLTNRFDAGVLEHSCIDCKHSYMSTNNDPCCECIKTTGFKKWESKEVK